MASGGNRLSLRKRERWGEIRKGGCRGQLGRRSPQVCRRKICGPLLAGKQVICREKGGGRVWAVGRPQMEPYIHGIGKLEFAVVAGLQLR